LLGHLRIGLREEETTLNGDMVSKGLAPGEGRLRLQRLRRFHQDRQTHDELAPLSDASAVSFQCPAVQLGSTSGFANQAEPTEGTSKRLVRFSDFVQQTESWEIRLFQRRPPEAVNVLAHNRSLLVIHQS
jgi:hypothetical protein